jgi:hypothetical protein
MVLLETVLFPRLDLKDTTQLMEEQDQEDWAIEHHGMQVQVALEIHLNHLGQVVGHTLDKIVDYTVVVQVEMVN